MKSYRIEIPDRLPIGLESVIMNEPGAVREMVLQYGWNIEELVAKVKKPTDVNHIYWEGLYAENEDDTTDLAVVGILQTRDSLYLRAILVPDVPDEQRKACEAVLPQMIIDYLNALLGSKASELPPGYGKSGLN